MPVQPDSIWPAAWIDPSGMRCEKPRTQGLTMVLDKGTGLSAFCDLLEVASPFLDIYKLGFGTCVLYPPSLLRRKLEIAKDYGLQIMPGGTFFEIAHRRAPVGAYMKTLHSLGFNAVEISDGTFPLSAHKRQEAIACAVETGLTVFTEFGKKAAHYRAERDELLETLEADLYAGASYVIVEARESGTVGVCDGNGKIDSGFVQEIAQAAGDLRHRLIWEAPQKEQQVCLLQALGSDVNLGNIACTDALSLETLRRGLRSDTAVAFEQGRKTLCE